MKYKIVEEYGLYFIKYYGGWLSGWKYVYNKSGDKLAYLSQKSAIDGCKGLIDIK